ncbi:anti-sigma factor domain-containing protein, partial [Wukongibacter baidiensis]
MVHKGLVMEYTKDYIIVLTDDANYIKLKNKGKIDVGKKIMFIEEDIIKEKNKYVRPFIGVVAAVIMLMTIIIGQFGTNLIDSSKAYAIVSLDINPSLEFQIDKKEIVRKVKSLNKDGEELIDDSMIGMKIEDAITISIKKALNKNYLNGKNNIVLVSDVIIDDNPQNPTVIEKKIFKKVNEDNELENIDVIYVDSDKEDLEKARENQVSVGKYKVYEIVSKNNPGVKINDIKEKKVSEIVKENKELTNAKKVKTKKKDDKTKKQKNKEKNQKKKSKKENIEKQKNKK